MRGFDRAQSNSGVKAYNRQIAQNSKEKKQKNIHFFLFTNEIPPHFPNHRPLKPDERTRLWRYRRKTKEKKPQHAYLTAKYLSSPHRG